MTSTVLKSYKGISYEEAKEMQKNTLDAIKATQASQSYQIGTRRQQRALLESLYEALEFWSNIVSKCESGVAGIKVQRAIPQDF